MRTVKPRASITLAIFASTKVERMTIEELEEKVYRAVLRLLKTEDSWLRRVAHGDIAAMRQKLKEMKEGVHEEAIV